MQTQPTSQAPERPPLLVNPEFDVSAELAVRHYRISSVDRISLMLRRYRQGRTPAIMENKLLAHTLLRSMGAPVAPILYGAFGGRALGGWPRYDRAGLVAAIQRLRRKDFVLKSATDGMSHNLLLMSDARWRAEAWSATKAAALVESWILPQPDSHNQSGWYTRWGQRHEHRGMLLQAAAFDPQLLLCERYMAKKPEKASKRLLRRAQPYCTEPSREWNATAQSAFLAGSHHSSSEVPLSLELRVYVAWGSLAHADGRARLIPHSKHTASPNVLLGGEDFLQLLQGSPSPSPSLSPSLSLSHASLHSPSHATPHATPDSTSLATSLQLLQGAKRAYAYALDGRGGAALAAVPGPRGPRPSAASSTSGAGAGGDRGGDDNGNEDEAVRASGKFGDEYRNARYARVAALLGQHAPALERLAARVHEVTGADWFRLDTFMREERGERGEHAAGGGRAAGGVPPLAPLVVNELTYPGHLLIDLSAATPPARNGSTVAAPHDSLDNWLRGYRHGTRQPQDHSSHADALLSRLGIAPHAFAQSDFLSMDRPRDANYFETTRGTFDGSLASRCRPGECSAQELVR